MSLEVKQRENILYFTKVCHALLTELTCIYICLTYYYVVFCYIGAKLLMDKVCCNGGCIVSIICFVIVIIVGTLSSIPLLAYGKKSN